MQEKGVKLNKLRKIILIAILVAAITSLALFFFKGKQNLSTSTTAPTSTTNQVTPTQFAEKVDITASFEIYTNTTKRIFTASMYHNLSQDVYITADDPSIVHVKKTGITWDAFFATLPMQLSKECLVTGTKQTFCSGPEGTLRFFINDVENPDALDEIINEGDFLKITYGSD